MPGLGASHTPPGPQVPMSSGGVTIVAPTSRPPGPDLLSPALCEGWRLLPIGSAPVQTRHEDGSDGLPAWRLVPAIGTLPAAKTAANAGAVLASLVLTVSPLLWEAPHREEQPKCVPP